jgi:hypothetical protein
MRVFVVGIVALCFFSACGDDDVAPRPGACAVTADCAAGARCVDGACVLRADAGRDAGEGERDAGPPPDLGARDLGPMCTASEMPERTCNRLDDDCNGAIDDIDVAGDGLCDCLQIGVMGNPGSLASSSFQAWLTARGTSVTRFSLDATPLTAEQLAMFDVVILDRLVREYSAEEAALLRDFVAGGGGVLAMTGYDGSGADRTRPNGLFAGLGIEYLPELRNGPVTMFEAHPLTEGLRSVTFAGGYRVGELAGAPGTRMTVARLPDGAAGVAVELGEGRAFIWGDEWIQFDSEWSTMPEITQLWVNALGWLGPRDRCVVLL